MHFIIAILFVITVCLAFFEDRLKDTYKFIILVSYALFMVILATTKDIYHTADAIQYQDMFERNDFILYELMTEPSYIYISRWIIACGGTITTLFFIYAILTIPAKLRALYTLTPYIFTALIVYIPVYFEVHDMIQIRVAAAAMFLLSAIKPLADKRYVLSAILIGCGILFHYSAVCYIPFVFIGNRELGKIGRIIVALLVPFCALLYLAKMNLLSLIPSSLFGGKLDFYTGSEGNNDWDELSNPFLNLYFLGKCIILYLCLYYYDLVVSKTRYAPIVINLLAVSICILLSMATIPVIAGRISDLFGIIDCIAYTFLLYIISPKYIARISITLAGLFMLVYNMINTEYFT